MAREWAALTGAASSPTDASDTLHTSVLPSPSSYCCGQENAARKMFLITIIEMKLIVRSNTKIKLRKLRRLPRKMLSLPLSGYEGDEIEGLLGCISCYLFFEQYYIYIYIFVLACV